MPMRDTNLGVLTTGCVALGALFGTIFAQTAAMGGASGAVPALMFGIGAATGACATYLACTPSHAATRQPMFLRGVAIAAILIAVSYVILAFANVSPPDGATLKCDWNVPQIFSCLLGVRENLSGGVFGAAGALMAAWIAWVAIQKQIELQRKSSDTAELELWRQRHERAEVAEKGLEMVETRALRCLDYFDAPARIEARRHVFALRKVKAAGLLDNSIFPVTGSNLIAFQMARLIEQLREQFRYTDKVEDIGNGIEKMDDSEKVIAILAGEMRSLRDQIPKALDSAKHTKKAAEEIIGRAKTS